jgi:hypothetical protein
LSGSHMATILMDTLKTIALILKPFWFKVYFEARVLLSGRDILSQHKGMNLSHTALSTSFPLLVP